MTTPAFYRIKIFEQKVLQGTSYNVWVYTKFEECQFALGMCTP